MKKQIFTMVALACASAGFAQSADRQVIGSGGNSFSDPSVSVDYTVGESITATGVTGTFTVSQGFQQKSDNTSSIKETLSNASYRLYPNPAQDEVTLSVNSDVSFGLQVSLCNAVGQTVFSDGKVEIVQRQYIRNIPLNALPSGIYFVNLYGSGHTLLQSIRFVKQ